MKVPFIKGSLIIRSPRREGKIAYNNIEIILCERKKIIFEYYSFNESIKIDYYSYVIKELSADNFFCYKEKQ